MIKLRLISAILLTLALLSFKLPAYAANTPQGEIQVAYDGECSALVSANVAQAEAILAPNFVSTDVNNALFTRGEITQRLNSVVSQYHLRSCNTRVLSTRQIPGKYIVSVERTLIGAPSASLSQTVQLVQLQNDTWQAVNGRWELSTRAVNEQTFSANGHIVMHETRLVTP